MDFRWIVIIALWTLISGPILGGPSRSAGKSGQPVARAAKATFHHSARR
jgi:hypothetical protein